MKTILGVLVCLLLCVPLHATGPKLPPVVEEALRLVDTPYHYGAEGSDALDCSAFTQTCYRNIGLHIPRTSRAQFAYGQPVSSTSLKPGDLLFWRQGRGKISHVGLYLGNGYVAHATSRYDRVVVELVEAVNRRSRFAGARRVLAPYTPTQPRSKKLPPASSQDSQSVREALWTHARSILTTIFR
jgi:cell wall-associated NlpC family hydrolase